MNVSSRSASPGTGCVSLMLCRWQSCLTMTFRFLDERWLSHQVDGGQVGHQFRQEAPHPPGFPGPLHPLITADATLWCPKPAECWSHFIPSWEPPVKYPGVLEVGSLALAVMGVSMPNKAVALLVRTPVPERLFTRLSQHLA